MTGCFNFGMVMGSDDDNTHPATEDNDEIDEVTNCYIVGDSSYSSHGFKGVDYSDLASGKLAYEINGSEDSTDKQIINANLGKDYNAQLVFGQNID